jgi:hypothetical protein
MSGTSSMLSAGYTGKREKGKVFKNVKRFLLKQVHIHIH